MSVSPSVFRYADPRDYVRDWLGHRPRLSQRWLARKVGSSPSRVSMILSQQRTLPLEEAEQWARGLGLDDAESAHFEAMVAAEQAPTSALRAEAQHTVRAGQDYAQAAKLDSAAAWIGSWVHLAILVAARHPDFDGRPEPLAARLWPPVEVEVIEAAVADLLAAGALVHDGDRWSADDRPVRTAIRIQQKEVSAAAHRLHQDQLRHALQALDEVPGARRHIASVTVGVAQDRLEALLQSARELPLRMVAAHADEPADEVVEVVIATYARTTSPT